MSQFPRTRFNPLRRKASSRDFSLLLRNVLALGLAALMFLAPLGFTVTVSAQESNTTSKPTQANHFIVYQDANGEVVCRAASLVEQNQLERIDTPNQGLHQINHLKGAVKEFSHSTGAQAGANDGTGLIIKLRATNQLLQNQAAVDAFNRAAQNWESLILSPVTIYIDVDYGPKDFGQPWGANVLGATSTPSDSYRYQAVRTNLVAQANGEGNATKQAIFNALPSTNVPTDLGNGSRIDVTDPIARAIGLLPATAPSTDPAARIAFNSGSNQPDGFDFDPSNGITPGQIDFDAVATHEIGHALGFDSDAGLELSRPSIWDLYRFRTGTTSGSFTTAPRIITIGGAPDPLQFNFIPGNAELGLSTGGPDPGQADGDGWQSSHWRHSSFSNGVTYIGIMDPAIAPGVRRQITPNDILALTSFGYNLTNSVAPPAAPAAPPTPAPPANDSFFNPQVIIGCSGSVAGTNEGATKEAGELNNPDSSTSTRSVWYQWQSPSTGSVTINTRGSDFDTVLAVYTGSTFGTLSPIANNDDIVSGQIVPSTVTFNATQGTTYRIQVNGFNNPGSGGGEVGNIKLNWTEDNCVQATPTVQLSQSTNAVGEGAGHVDITVTRTDSAAAASVSYATSDTAGLTNCNVTGTGIASSRCDYATSVGTVRFAIGETSRTISIPVVDDNFSEGSESFTLTLSNPVGIALGSLSTTTVTITDNASTPGNPVDSVPFFVRQNYIDFLGREPDSFGNTGWQAMLNNCAAGDITCDRIEVSSRFFRSTEFQERGYYVYRFYSASLGRKPNYEEFIPDVAKVSGFLTDAEKEANKVAFVDEFMQRTEFKSKYDTQVTPTAYVDALLTTAGLPNHPSRAGWIAGLGNGSLSRGQVLRQLAESGELSSKFNVEAFVVMQYFGYLRRNPDKFYLDWIAIMNQDPANYRNMVNGFMNSAEYRARFAP